MSNARVELAPPAPITEVEQFGIEPIPAEHRNAKVFDFFRVVFGGANTFATVVLGAFPIMFGLSFWQGFVAMLVGLIVGAVILAPMSLFGPRNGTNNAVSSSAHLGVEGRLVGSFLSLLTAFAFFSISVWSSGDALVGAASRLTGVSFGEGWYAVAYALFAVLVFAVCIYGFRFMLWVNKIAVPVATILFLIGIPAFWGLFDPSYPGIFGDGADSATQALFWPSFVGGALVVLSNPVSFGAFLGDWARYLPATTPKWKLLTATFLAQMSTVIPFTFGLATASVVAAVAPEYLDSSDYVGGLLAVSPAWYFIPIGIIAVVGGMSTGVTSLYGTGLDFSSVFPRFSRVQATVFIGAIAIAFIFFGRFVLNLVQSISTFATLIITCTAPWMIVMMIGFITRRGWYDVDSLQVFNRRQVGGRYWFARGWNPRGLVSWIVAALVGLAFSNMPGQFVGPLGEVFGGVDLSLPISLVVAAVLYLGMLYLFPEPSYVFGPDGPRFVPSVDKGDPKPISARGAQSATSAAHS